VAAKSDFEFAFLNRNAVLVTFRFVLRFRRVRAALRLGASSRVAPAQQRLCVHFPFEFFYTQDTCSLGFGIVFGIFAS